MFAQNFSDDFTNSQVLTAVTITIADSNTNATLESGEPRIAGKIGGHSVWIAWQAPSDGFVTMTSDGSSFDTLLGVYVQESGNIPSLRRLESVAANDDFGGLITSTVQFGANSNQTYYVSLDGFNGAVGDISFALNFLSSTNIQPTVLTSAGDRALRLGDPLILTVNFIPTSAHLDLKWYLNGASINDAEQPTLVIPNLQATNLGFYALKFILEDDSFISAPIEIQVNSEGQETTLARYKIADAAQSGLKPALTPGVTIGYNGTQIYNTTNAIIDPTAPLICGVAPGAAYWFSYTAPTNGWMTVDTGGSIIPTLLAAFTYNGVLVSYTNLIALGCDNNSSGTGTNTFTQIQFAVTNGGKYFIVVGGVNGARGIVHLNYSLVGGLPPAPPVLTSQPQPLIVSANTAVALSSGASGTGPLTYQWWKNSSKMRSQTNASMLLSQPAMSDSGNYFVVITNSVGAVTSAPVKVNVINAPMLALNPATATMVTAFPAKRGYQYKADCAGSLVASSWLNFTNGFPDYGGILWLTNSTRSNNCLFLRVHTP